jgi:anti-sigma B factor antagonist
MEPSFRTRAESCGDALVVHVDGDLDLTTAERLRHDMSQLVGDGPELVLDLTDVSFMDSEGISALLATRSAVLEHGGSLAIRNLSSTVRRALEVTGLAGLLIDPESP